MAKPRKKPPSGFADPSILSDWKAKDWQQIRTIWSALVPKESKGGPIGSPSFRSQLLLPEEKGYVFERWVQEAFRLSGMEVEPSFKNRLEAGLSGVKDEDGRHDEQFDGAVYDGWQAFLLESKYQEEAVKIGPIAQLERRVQRRPTGTLGLFFSVSGYTASANREAAEGEVRVLFFEKDDLEWALKPERKMRTLVRRKWRDAVRTGKPWTLIS